jgi:hypothetical protein
MKFSSKQETMETRAKKAKMQQEMISLGPLEKVCNDVHELIFQHLDKHEVLRSTEVSPEWNFAISKSAVAMAKFTLKFHSYDPIPEVIKRSERNYNKLIFRIDYS